MIEIEIETLEEDQEVKIEKIQEAILDQTQGIEKIKENTVLVQAKERKKETNHQRENRNI